MPGSAAQLRAGHRERRLGRKLATSLRGLTRWEQALPLGSHQLPPKPFSTQGARRCTPEPRTRRCALKGCGRLFLPEEPGEWYCSDPCRAEAHEWVVWRAQQTYRRSEGGREHRRSQARGYRARVKARKQAAATATELTEEETEDEPEDAPSDPEETEDEPEDPPSDPEETEDEPEDPPSDPEEGSEGGCEGHRFRPRSPGIWFRPCDRPGCYEWFAFSARSPLQRFCSSECQGAVERVLSRERRWRRAYPTWRPWGSRATRASRRILLRSRGAFC